MPPITDVKVDWVIAEAEDEVEAEAEIVAEAERLAVGVSDETAVPPEDSVVDTSDRLERLVTSDGESDFEVVVELVENALPMLLTGSKDRDDDELPLATMMEPVLSAVKVVAGVP